ncbi:MAG TPA: nucleoside recognition domain-containing protein [Bacteroidia bacterium]|nr:nucleoside recognition domain-containing protein [Bacteroidia bacterium]
MILNYIWVAFFIIAFIVGLIRLIVFGDASVFPNIVNSTFDSAKTAFDISLGLTGAMSLWLGIMKVGEKAGAINFISRVVGPFFNRLFPEIPKNHPAIGSILMNFSANMLGLDNAATPLGLKAMQSLQELNPDKERASNAQIMFLVLNTSGLTLIPVTIMAYRIQLGAANPADIFIPILISTYFATLIGMILTAIKQKINLFDRVLISWILGVSACIGGIIYYFASMPQADIARISSIASNFILFTIITSFFSVAFFRKINVYESFVEGAKEGFHVAVKVIPYLIAMLVAIGVFRASGAMDILISGTGHLFAAMGFNTDFVPALPTAFMKPLSGSGARGMMLDTMHTYGADSFAGRLSCVFQGSADTTFYIVALYFGSVGVKKTRYAVPFGLMTDLAGAIAAIFISYLFFHK